jgi:ubiquinone/menaquinone biosynthesis C-methylase UbiE
MDAGDLVGKQVVTEAEATFMTWEQAVQWARNSPEMADLVKICYYDDPIVEAANRFLRSEELPAILEVLEAVPGQQVLEVGGGRGIVSWALAKAGFAVTVLEPDPSEIVGQGAIRSLCKATGVSLKIVDRWGESLPFGDAEFDHVICRAVLHHARDLKRMCAEVHRVLKPGGRFLAMKEHIADTPEELAYFLKTHPLHHLYGGEHAYPRAEYLESLRLAGYRKVQEYGHFDHPVSWSPHYTIETLRKAFTGALGRRLPAGLAARVAKATPLVRAYGRWLSRRSKVGGRLVSFLATKA